VETLVDRYHVIALPSRPLWPDSRPESAPGWRVMAGDLVRGLDEMGLAQVIGIGHSMGGDLTLWAAVWRPDLFRAVVLIDPVILPPAWLWVVRLMRLLGLRGRLPLVQGALRRRRVWPSRQACYEHYRQKPLLAAWPDAVLWAYVESGTRERTDGRAELVYAPEWEAHIYATVPVDIWRAVPRLRTPALVIQGERSETFKPESLARMRRLLPQADYAIIPGAGHLVPMERPLAVGAAIRDFLEGLDQSRSGGRD
jgi:pimeloyl-ACP methyl ester carboxylesterase